MESGPRGEKGGRSGEEAVSPIGNQRELLLQRGSALSYHDL